MLKDKRVTIAKNRAANLFQEWVVGVISRQFRHSTQTSTGHGPVTDVTYPSIVTFFQPARPTAPRPVSRDKGGPAPGKRGADKATG